jgi:hypothetical protein
MSCHVIFHVGICLIDLDFPSFSILGFHRLTTQSLDNLLCHIASLLFGPNRLPPTPSTSHVDQVTTPSAPPGKTRDNRTSRRGGGSHSRSNEGGEGDVCDISSVLCDDQRMVGSRMREPNDALVAEAVSQLVATERALRRYGKEKRTQHAEDAREREGSGNRKAVYGFPCMHDDSLEILEALTPSDASAQNGVRSRNIFDAQLHGIVQSHLQSCGGARTSSGGRASNTSTLATSGT